jgi:hypothetical protein
MTVSLVGGVRHPKVYAYTTDAYKDTPWRGDQDADHDPVHDPAR